MPGIGAALLIVAYGVGYAATKQMLGVGGSVLYWLTGNPSFGAPPPQAKGGGGGGGGGSSPPPGSKTGPGGAPTPVHRGAPVIVK